MMSKKIATAAGTVAVSILSLVLLTAGSRGSAASQAAAASPPLVSGNRYMFCCDRGVMLEAIALDAPVGNWIKVKSKIGTGQEAVHWVNLNAVTYVIEAPPG